MGLLETRPQKRRRIGLWIPLLAVLGCGLIAIGIAVAGTILSEEEEKSVENSVTYGLTLSPSGIDPHINSSAELGIPLYSVYDTLIYRHPQTFDFVAGLAERWDISPDGRTYTFHLRQDVTFHDGTPFNANAVGVTLDRIVDESDPNTLSQKARVMLGPFYEGYVINDDYTLDILLSQPYAPLLDALSQPYLGIASPTAIANSTRATYQLKQVGTGPYKMVNYIPGDRIVLERNKAYGWGPVFYANLDDSQAVQRITFRFFQDEQTRRVALEAGDVQIIGELPPNDAEILLANREFQLYEQNLPGQPLQFYFNTTRFPTDDPNIRRALLYVTNRESIVETVFRSDFSPIAYGPLTASMPFYDPSVQNFYSYDPQQARDLFRVAGFTDTDGDSILDKEGTPLKLKLVIPGWGFLPDVVVLLQSQWREIGIDVEIEQVPGFGALIAAADENEYNLIAFNNFGTDPSLINPYYLSDSSSNWTHFGDPDLDIWLNSALTTTDTVQREEFYRLAQNKIMEQALILPIRDYVSLVGWVDTLDGLIFSPQGWWPLLNNLQFQGQE